MIADASTMATEAWQEDRVYQRKLTEALFDATVYRLETARARLGLVPAPDPEILPLHRRIQSLVSRLGALKFNTTAYQEMRRHECGCDPALQRRVLDLAEFADNLAMRLGAPGDDVGLLSEIAAELDAFTRLVDSCLKLADDPALL